jgi:hypothetical protein
MGDHPRIVQVELVEQIPEALRQFHFDLAQLPGVFLGAFFPFVLRGTGYVIIFGAKTLEQIRSEELHGFFLALSFTVS